MREPRKPARELCRTRPDPQLREDEDLIPDQIDDQREALTEGSGRSDAAT